MAMREAEDLQWRRGWGGVGGDPDWRGEGGGRGGRGGEETVGGELVEQPRGGAKDTGVLTGVVGHYGEGVVAVHQDAGGYLYLLPHGPLDGPLPAVNGGGHR